MYADKLSEVLDSKKKVKDLDKIFEDDDDGKFLDNYCYVMRYLGS